MRYSSIGYRTLPDEIAIEVGNGILSIDRNCIRLMPLDNKKRKYKFAVTYDPKAKATVFMAALNIWFTDREERELFRKHIADALFQTNGYYSGKALHVLDIGGNGAKACFACVRPLFGKYATSIPLLGLCNKEKCDNVVQLKNSLLNISIDNGFEMFDLGILRQLINIRPNPIRTTLMDSFTVSPPKLVFSTDFVSDYVSDRSLCFDIDNISICMDQPLEKAHPYLVKVIIDKELPGILNWVLEGVQLIFAESALIKSHNVKTR